MNQTQNRCKNHKIETYYNIKTSYYNNKTNKPTKQNDRDRDPFDSDSL